MGNTFFNTCERAIERYLTIPEVKDTFDKLEKGIDYINNYPQNDIDFVIKKNEIINYIVNVRKDNFFDAAHDIEKVFFCVNNSKNSKPMQYDTRCELYEQLVIEIKRLCFKGVYQIIKALNSTVEASNLIVEIFRQDVRIFEKYNIKI